MKKTGADYTSTEQESARLAALQNYRILDTVPDIGFDELAILATDIFSLPICIISFTGKDEVFFKANIGLREKSSEPRKNSIAGQTIPAGEVMVLENLNGAPDFFHALYNINFFAGAPLILPDGHNAGNLVVMGSESIQFGKREREILIGLSKNVVTLMEARLSKFNEGADKKELKMLDATNRKILNENSMLQRYNEQIALANSDLENVLDSYELLFKHAPVAIGICSYQDRVIWQANDALLNIFGDGSVAIGAKIESLISSINGKTASDTFDLIDFDSNAYHSKGAKLKIHHIDGYKCMYVDLSLQLVGRMGDESQNIMFILADVTEQVILNQIAREANVVLMNAIKDTGMGYTIVEFETGLMESNDQFKSNYGYSSEEPVSYPDIFNAMLPQYRDTIKLAVSHAISTKGIYQAEYEVRWRDGSIHRIRAYGKPMYDADGKATHIIGLNKIISEN